MAWIESHDDIWEHFKLDDLQQRLAGEFPGLDAEEQRVLLVGHLHSLWHFTLRNAWRDADLTRWGDLGIERAARWRRKPGLFIEALRGSGLIDGCSPHGWMDRAGDLVQKRLDRESARREKLAGTERGTVGGRTATERGATVTNHPDIPDHFTAFWSVYPKKEAKQDALKAWRQVAPDADTVERIIADVRRRALTEKWRNDGGKYIPLPATYLRGRRYEDQGVVLPRPVPVRDTATTAHLAARGAA